MTAIIFKIEKGVPIPKQGKRGKGVTGVAYYPFPDMEPGDSFLAPDGYYKKLVAALWKAKYDNRVPKEWQFVFRILDDGVRCWRVE